MSADELPGNLKNILCIRLDAMGDVLMTEPAIRALSEWAPQAKITLLTSRSGALAAKLCASVDEILVFDVPWMKHSEFRDGGEVDLEFIASLRERSFDAAVIFTVYSQTAWPAALYSYLADIPIRVAHLRENPYHLLTHWQKEIEPQFVIRHEVRRQLDLVQTLGAHVSDERIQVNVPESAKHSVSVRLQRMRLREGGYIVAHPGATASSRRYPHEKFAKALRELGEFTHLPVIITGTEGERDLLQDVARGAGPSVRSLVLDLDLGEFAELLKCARLLISNNTGAVHLAAGVGTPIVDLYALTNPQHTPWMVPQKVLSHDVECRNCYKSSCPLGHGHCLSLIDSSEVARAALSLLDETEDYGSFRLSSCASGPHPPMTGTLRRLAKIKSAMLTASIPTESH